MADFNKFFPILLRNEEGYESAEEAKRDHDSGGETWEGISRNNYPGWSGWPLIDSHKSDPDFPHVLKLDATLADKVTLFYKGSQWDPIRGDDIKNQSIMNYIADWGVNAGLSVPVKHTQTILKLVPDGKVGPATIAAINSADGEYLFNRLVQDRIKFYNDIVDKNPAKKVWLKGWLIRANSFKYQA